MALPARLLVFPLLLLSFSEYYFESRPPSMAEYWPLFLFLFSPLPIQLALWVRRPNLEFFPTSLEEHDFLPLLPLRYPPALMLAAIFFNPPPSLALFCAVAFFINGASSSFDVLFVGWGLLGKKFFCFWLLWFSFVGQTTRLTRSPFPPLPSGARPCFPQVHRVAARLPPVPPA